MTSFPAHPHTHCVAGETFIFHRETVLHIKHLACKKYKQAVRPGFFYKSLVTQIHEQFCGACCVAPCMEDCLDFPQGAMIGKITRCDFSPGELTRYLDLQPPHTCAAFSFSSIEPAMRTQGTSARSGYC